jgi:hypothetical protein
MAGDKPQIFISYARVDWEDGTAGKVLTCALKALEGNTRAQLGDRGCTFWQDGQLRWGDAWRARLHKVIGDCDLFILMVSPGWLKSEMCLEEYQAIKARAAALGSGRVLPISLHPIKARDVTVTPAHRSLHDDLRGIQFQDWSQLPVMTEADRTIHIRAAGEALAERVQEMRNGGSGSVAAVGVPRQPTDVMAVPVVSGTYYIPLPGQSPDARSDAPLMTAMLQLAFSGLAKITTAKGTLVFTVRQALLHSTVTGGRIANTRAFPEGWNGPRAEVTRISVGASYETLRLRWEAGLDGEVLAGRGDAGHVRLFDIAPSADKVQVTGVVKVDFEAVHVALDQSTLKRAAPADAERRRRLEAELAKLVLEECGGDTFTLEGDAR